MIWTILLAGGSGARLARESMRRFGCARPKQYSDFGEGTLLELTLGRARKLVPDRRIVVITTRLHRNDALAVMRRHPDVIHLEQPRNRDTTSGVLMPVLYVRQIDPDATVVVMPTDHAVADVGAFHESLLDALALVREHGEHIALLAAEPCGSDEDYGWAVPEPDVSGAAPNAASGRWPAVARFVEKPPHDEVPRLRAAGALVNTFVLVARAATLEDVFRGRTPQTLQRLRQGMHDPDLLEEAFDRIPDSSFSRDVLEHIPERLRLVPLPEKAGWSDIGTPERLARVYRPSEAGPARTHGEA